MDQAQLGIEEVEVQHALFGLLRRHQVGPALAGDQLEAGAAFHTTEDADQALVDRSFLQDFLSRMFVLA